MKRIVSSYVEERRCAKQSKWTKRIGECGKAKNLIEEHVSNGGE